MQCTTCFEVEALTRDNGRALQVALIGYGQYTVAGVTTRYWAMENSWGLPSSHDRGVFYLDADADWGTLVGGYVMYHQNTLSAELPLTVVKTLVECVPSHPS